MNIFPVPVPVSVFQPLANYWLPANQGRVIIVECEGGDYLCIDGECRLLYELPSEVKGEEYPLLFGLVNMVREPVQWADLFATVPPDSLISWCERYGMLLPMEIIVNGREGTSLTMTQVEVLTLYLGFRHWENLLQSTAETRYVLEQEQQERLRLIELLFRRCVGCKKLERSSSGYLEMSLEVFSPAYLLYTAARERNAAKQLILLKAFLDDVMSQRFIGLTPRLSLLHSPPRWVMQAQCPLTVAYWQLASSMLQHSDGRRYHVCQSCGRWFHGHANRKYCRRCDRRTHHSRNVRAKRSSRNRITS